MTFLLATKYVQDKPGVNAVFYEMDIGSFSKEIEKPERRMEKASGCGVEVSGAWGLYVGMIVSKKCMHYFR